MSAQLDPQIVARVRRGVAFLDKRVPGWREQVNPATLDISTHHYCVLGQLYGDYFAGCMWLGLSTEASVRNGFNTGDVPANSLMSYFTGLRATRATFNDLNLAWQQELAA